MYTFLSQIIICFGYWKVHKVSHFQLQKKIKVSARVDSVFLERETLLENFRFWKGRGRGGLVEYDS